MPSDRAAIQQPPWGLEAVQPHAEDPTWELRDSPAVVEVTTLLGDSALGLRQLHPRCVGEIRPASWALLLTGGAAVTLGLWQQVMWRWAAGEGALLLLLGTALLVLGVGWARRQLRSPHFSVGPDQGADLCLDHPTLPGSRFSLVRRRSWGYELLFAPRMLGQVQRGSTTSSLTELQRRGQAWPSSSL